MAQHNVWSWHKSNFLHKKIEMCYHANVIFALPPTPSKWTSYVCHPKSKHNKANDIILVFLLLTLNILCLLLTLRRWIATRLTFSISFCLLIPKFLERIYIYYNTKLCVIGLFYNRIIDSLIYFYGCGLWSFWQNYFSLC